MQRKRYLQIIEMLGYIHLGGESDANYPLLKQADIDIRRASTKHNKMLQERSATTKQTIDNFIKAGG